MRSRMGASTSCQKKDYDDNISVQTTDVTNQRLQYYEMRREMADGPSQAKITPRMEEQKAFSISSILSNSKSKMRVRELTGPKVIKDEFVLLSPKTVPKQSEQEVSELHVEQKPQQHTEVVQQQTNE